MIPSANHLLTYEKEFAANEDSLIPKPGFFGDFVHLLFERSDPTARVDLVRSPLRVFVSPHHAEHVAGVDGLVSRQHLDP